MFEAVRKARAGNEQGFTLIELMIVVAIIGIVAAIAIPQFSAYRQRAYVASMKADCYSIKLAEKAYFADNDMYKVTADPASDLANYGFKNFSSGNSAAVTATDSAVDFTVTVNSDKTDKSVVYVSTTGVTTTI